MEKKLIFIVLLATIMITAASCSEFADTVSGNIGFDPAEPYVSDEEFALKYYPVEAHFEGEKLYVTGAFVNDSSVNDILCIDEAEIILIDKNGDEQARAKVNSRFAQNCMISPNGSVSYNFSCRLPGSTTINSAWDVQYDVMGSYQYDACQGTDCPYCGGKTSSAWPSDGSGIGDDSSSSGVTCPKCGGTGECEDCGGTGKSKLSSPVLSAMGCALCDATGKCYKCNGTGHVY